MGWATTAIPTVVCSCLSAAMWRVGTHNNRNPGSRPEYRLARRYMLLIFWIDTLAQSSGTGPKKFIVGATGDLINQSRNPIQSLASPSKPIPEKTWKWKNDMENERRLRKQVEVRQWSFVSDWQLLLSCAISTGRESEQVLASRG